MTALILPEPHTSPKSPHASDILNATRRFTSENRAASWWCVSSTLVLLLTAATLAALIAGPWYLRLALSIFAGLLWCRMFVLYHDYQHGAILRRSRPARLLMTGFGLLSVTPPSVWKSTHNHHHHHHGELEEDAIGSFPVMTVAQYYAAGWARRLAYAVQRHWLVVVAAYPLAFLWSFTVRPLLRTPRAHWDCGLALALHLGVTGALAYWSPSAAVLGLVLPCSIAAAMGVYLFYIQHNFPSVDLRSSEDWDYVTASIRGSSFLATNRLMHWFTANIGYHHVHHLNPRIPFYRLPEAMRHIPELQVAGGTTLRPTDILRCLRLKLWDESTHSLVSFKAARASLEAARLASVSP